MKSSDYKTESAEDAKSKVIAVFITAVILICGLIGIIIYAFKTYDKQDISSISKTLSNKTSNIKSTKIDKENDDEDSDNSSDNINESSNNSSFYENINEKAENEQQKTVKNFLDSVRKMNFNEAYKYTEDNKCSMDKVAELLKQEDTSIVRYHYFFKKMMNYSYYLGDTKVKGNEAFVDIKINTYNFTTTVLDARLHITDAQLAAGLISKSVDKEKKNKIAVEELNKIFKDKDKTLSIPVKVKLIKKNGKWKIAEESVENDIKGAVMGNLIDSIDAYADYYKKINDGTISELSVDSFIKYLKSEGIEYDPDSQSSPFDKK